MKYSLISSYYQYKNKKLFSFPIKWRGSKWWILEKKIIYLETNVIFII